MKKKRYPTLDVLSTNMLDDEDKNRLMEEKKMRINPREEYFLNKGKEEGIKEGKLETAKNLLKKGMPLKEVMELTGLTEKQIQNAK